MEETVTDRQARQRYSDYIRYHDIVLRGEQHTSHDLRSGNVSSVEATVTLSCCIKDNVNEEEMTETIWCINDKEVMSRSWTP